MACNHILFGLLWSIWIIILCTIDVFQHAATILNTFQGIKLDFVSSSDHSMNLGYFAKYLTSQKLLDLQLHDVNFRRSVLLQFLIVFQYFTSAVKFKAWVSLILLIELEYLINHYIDLYFWIMSQLYTFLIHLYWNCSYIHFILTLR